MPQRAAWSGKGNAIPVGAREHLRAQPCPFIPQTTDNLDQIAVAVDERAVTGAPLPEWGDDVARPGDGSGISRRVPTLARRLRGDKRRLLRLGQRREVREERAEAVRETLFYRLFEIHDGSLLPIQGA